MTHAQAHRYRTRNIHDGRPLPPCWLDRTARRVPDQAFGAVDDRCDAIVGRQGYVFSQDGHLEVYLAYKSRLGVNRAAAKLAELGGAVMQEGDTEVGGWAPVAKIEAVCQMIQAAKRPKGNRQASAEHMKATRFPVNRQCTGHTAPRSDDMTDPGV
jgi:hypothetical protein